MRDWGATTNNLKFRAGRKELAESILGFAVGNAALGAVHLIVAG